jgi:hypothetical protein
LGRKPIRPCVARPGAQVRTGGLAGFSRQIKITPFDRMALVSSVKESVTHY